MFTLLPTLTYTPAFWEYRASGRPWRNINQHFEPLDLQREFPGAQMLLIPLLKMSLLLSNEIMWPADARRPVVAALWI